MEQRILELEKKMTEMEKDKEKDKKNIDEIAHACMELQGTVQRQMKQLQKHEKLIAGQRENTISLQKYAKEIKPVKMISPVQKFPTPSETQVPRHVLDVGSFTYDKVVLIGFAGLTSYIVALSSSMTLENILNR